MIVWLASYPRSGNTALRIILRQAFGIETYSEYDDIADIGSEERLSELVGHRAHGISRDRFAASAAASTETFFVKTHELPRDARRAIYVLRDGRSAIASYYHYRQDFADGDATLAEVVLGAAWGCGWSDHVRAWHPTARKDTLLLRFPDLVVDPESAIEQLAGFLGWRPTGALDSPFERLHAMYPRFFRTGSDEHNIAEVEAAHPVLFRLLHGRTMVETGLASRAEMRVTAKNIGCDFPRETWRAFGELWQRKRRRRASSAPC